MILATRTAIGEAAFAEWGWRIPFILSVALLGVSVYIRLSMNESPAFAKMKAEGKTSKAPLSESFGQWKNLKIVILALVGLTAGQAVVWYSSPAACWSGRSRSPRRSRSRSAALAR